MSKHRQKKFLDVPLKLERSLSRKPILVSDSKGNYLKGHSDIIEEFGYSFEFACKGGARFQDQYYWLNRNLHKLVQKYGDLVLYVWLGTCDLTNRRGRFIDLRHTDDNTAVSYIKFQIDRFVSYISFFPTVKIVFLEIPPYSIEHWNRSKGHCRPADFHENDLILTERIALANDYIQEVNEKAGALSPKFKFDLVRNRKSNRKTPYKRVCLNFGSYKDGIHPDILLARCWMKRIIARVFKDCL